MSRMLSASGKWRATFTISFVPWALERRHAAHLERRGLAMSADHYDRALTLAPCLNVINIGEVQHPSRWQPVP